MKNIQEMLQELLSSGWSQSALARELMTNQPTIHRLAIGGQEPGYGLGKRIEHLYGLEAGKKAA